MSFKKRMRKEFRKEVFTRDGYKCRGCGKQGYDHNDPEEVVKQNKYNANLVPLDAHHITGRDEMPAGGYVKENGISLCPECHMKAESPHSANIEFQPENLYRSIGSSKKEAKLASLGLKQKIEKFEDNEESITINLNKNNRFSSVDNQINSFLKSIQKQLEENKAKLYYKSPNVPLIVVKVPQSKLDNLTHFLKNNSKVESCTAGNNYFEPQKEN